MKKLVVLALLGLAPVALAMENKTVTLVSNDKQEFTISVSAAQQSETIKNLIQDADISKPVPLEYIDGATLARVVDILNRLDGMNPDKVAKLRQFKLSQDQINEQDEFTKSLSYLDVPLIAILETSNGQSFIPLKLALRISFFEGMIPLFGAYNPIPIVQFDGQTMDILVQLLEALEPFLARNEEVVEAQQIYIPRAYQPEANKILAPLETQQIATLSDAADYFDLPFIQNATGAVIAERINDPIHLTRTGEWRYWNQEERLSILDSTLCHLNISIENIDYLLKHLTLKSNDITQEYSIADYIRTHYAAEYCERSTIDLRDNKLTSLFGIKSLPNPEQVTRLDLLDNCLYSPQLDPQSPPKPFAQFCNLKKLFLNNSQLTNIQKNFFDSLCSLTFLQVSVNRLSHLPDTLLSHMPNLNFIDLKACDLHELPDALFKHNPHLEKLDLNGNKLSHLSQPILESLRNIKKLNLSCNYFDQAEVDRIRSFLRQAEVIANYLRDPQDK